MYTKDLKQILDDKALHYMNVTVKRPGLELKLKDFIEDLKSKSEYPKQENEHNALADAKWNYKFLEK